MAVLAFVVALVPVSACASDPAAPPAPTTSDALPSRATLDELDPCALITDDQATDFGYDNRQAAPAGSRGCTYSDSSSGASLVVSFADMSIDEVRPIDPLLISSGQINGRRTIMIQASDGPRCTRYLAVGPSASVLVQAVRPLVDSAAACQHVDNVADLVELSLP